MNGSQDILAQLRDIHEPVQGVSIFPIAPAWWGLFLLLLLLYFLVKFIIKKIKQSKKRYVLKVLKNLEIENPIESAIICSNMLRRVCLLQFKRSEFAKIYGDEWVEFLNDKSEKIKFQEQAKSLLIDAPYIQKETKKYSKEDAEELKILTIKWVEGRAF